MFYFVNAFPKIFIFFLQNMDFNVLLQEAQKLTNETSNSEALPRVERSLPQVLQATHELHSRVTQTGAQDIQA